MTNALERTRALEGRSLQGVQVLHSENWLEIELECVGTEIKAKAQGPGDTRASYHSFGPALDVESLRQFSQEVEKAATQARSLALPTLKRAQTIHQALFQGTLNKLLERQRGAAGNEKLLLRLMLPPEGSLQEFPWEALCAPDTLFGFLGNSTDVLLARGVVSDGAPGASGSAGEGPCAGDRSHAGGGPAPAAERLGGAHRFGGDRVARARGGEEGSAALASTTG